MEDLRGNVAARRVSAEREARVGQRPGQRPAGQAQRVAWKEQVFLAGQEQHHDEQHQPDKGRRIAKVKAKESHAVLAACADAWIEPRIGHIDDEVDDDDQHRRDEHDAQQGVEVSLHD